MIKSALAFFGLAGAIYGGLAWFNAGSPGVERLAGILGAQPVQVAAASQTPPPPPAQSIPTVISPAVAAPAPVVTPAAAAPQIPPVSAPVTPPAVQAGTAPAKAAPAKSAAAAPPPATQPRPVVMASAAQRTEQPRIIASRPSATPPEAAVGVTSNGPTPSLVSMVAASRTPLEPAPLRPRRSAQPAPNITEAAPAPVLEAPAPQPAAPAPQPKPQGPEL